MPSSADPRFINIQTDPRFRLPSKRDTHVKVDKRFSRMLKDERFTSKAKVDRYGRKLPKDSGRKELERFYQVEEDGLEGNDDEDVERELRRMSKVQKRKKEGEKESESSSSSSSSEEDTSEEEEEEEEEVVFGPGEGQADSIPTGDVSSRLAVVNLDWDNIRAVDLMAVFSSFVPGNGRILKISIYPSEFGKERMEREEMEGPPKEIFGRKPPKEQTAIVEGTRSETEEEENSEGSDSEVDDEKIKQSLVKEDNGEEFDATRLRKYQLERLRYFYAVLTCSSKSTAEQIYNAVDGTEYLTTANFFDLRFIPDEMEFSDDKPRDECERIPDGYRPNEFVTDALQHSKVSLSWDADDGSRKEAQRRAFGGSRAEIDENDLKAYLGSDSSDEEEMVAEIKPQVIVVDATNMHTVSDDKDAAESVPGPEQTNPATDSNLSRKEQERKRMRSLLGLPDESISRKKAKTGEEAPVGDMQITFSAGLSTNPSKGNSIFENEPLIEETTVERYIRKERERKARRKEKAKLTRNGAEPTLDEDGIEDEVNGGKAEEQDLQKDQDLGFDDPFFTEPGAEDKSSSNATRKEAKRKKRAEREAAEALSSAQRAELELLIAEDQAPISGSAGTKEIQHFAMPTLLKAEKLLKKNKGKKGKLSASAKEALQAKEKDTFKMDVGDERFRAVFERSEYAIDPSSKTYKESEGLRALVEEGRRRKGNGEGYDDEGGDARQKGHGDQSKKRNRGKGAVVGAAEERKNMKRGRREEGKEKDVKRLLNKVKVKSKIAS